MFYQAHTKTLDVLDDPLLVSAVIMHRYGLSVVLQLGVYIWLHLCESDSKVLIISFLSQEDCKGLEADYNWKWLSDGLQKSRSVIKLCAEFSQKCLHSLYAYIKLFERLMSISAIIGHGSVLVFTSYYRCWTYILSDLALMEMDIKNFPFSSFKCLSRSLGTFNVH